LLNGKTKSKLKQNQKTNRRNRWKEEIILSCFFSLSLFPFADLFPPTPSTYRSLFLSFLISLFFNLSQNLCIRCYLLFHLDRIWRWNRVSYLELSWSTSMGFLFGKKMELIKWNLLLWSIERDGSLKFENEKLVFEILFPFDSFYSDDASVLHMSESDGTLLAPAFPVFFLFVLI
jgi:hypothetical protein